MIYMCLKYLIFIEPTTSDAFNENGKDSTAVNCDVTHTLLDELKITFL